MQKQAILDITVSPKSSKQEIRVSEDGSIRVYLNAPPVEGKANAACVELFAKTLRMAKSKISIEKGEKGRKKRIQIDGATADEVMNILKGRP